MTQSKRERIIKFVSKSVTCLNKLNLEFVLSLEDLVEQLCNFDGKTADKFKTKFKRTDIIYVHDKLVRICDVLSGHTKIWTNDEKINKQRADNNKPRGIDADGDKETNRFLAFFKLFEKLSKRFKVVETVRGSIVDIILTSIRDSSVSFGLQIATAEMSSDKFGFNKTIANVLKCLEYNLFVLFIGVIDGQIAGVYLIPPIPSVKTEFQKFKPTLNIQPNMLSRSKSSSELTLYLQTFRYISSDFQNGNIKGNFKNLDEFSNDFLNMLCDNYDKVMNTSDHFSSLFIHACKRTEWAGCKSFEIVNDTQKLGLIQTLIHGERGDVKLKFDDDHIIIDERKTLAILHNIESTSWNLPLRERGRQGLNPLKVNTTTAFIRCNRSMICPSEPNNFIGFVFLPILTKFGNLALRSDNPKALNLCMNCDTNKRDEWIRLNIDKIDVDTYPESMTEIITGSKYIKIKAVFYYDTLTKGSQRWNDFLYLFCLFSKRVPTKIAIDAYNNSVTPELIDMEKQKCRK